ncbi:MAG: DUF3592 domain-containing protein [Bryobacterales bacterium]|nr:DUF3592 domain-containing protein [Bryobacterales bacterium]
MGWMLVILGAVSAVMAGRQVAGLFSAGEGWLPVSATVLSARVSLSGDVAGIAQHRPVGRQGHSYREHHVYQEVVYFVDGKRYSAALDRGQFESRAAALSALTQMESPGAEISVWANVNDPAQVVMQPVQREAGVGAIAVFALLGLFAFPFGVSIVRSSAKAAGAPVASPAGLHSRPVTIH